MKCLRSKLRRSYRKKKKGDDILNHGADFVRNLVWKVVFWAVKI